jgi:hypothetical protein
MDGATNGGTFIGDDAEWMYKRPGIWAPATGSFDVLLDSANNFVLPPAVNTAGFSMVLTYGQDTADDTLTLTAILSELGVTAGVNTAVEGRYGFKGQSDVACAGTNSVYSTNSWSTYDWNKDTSGTHVLEIECDDGTTISGEAFLTGIRHACYLNQFVEVTLSGSYTGPLAFS